MQSRSLSAVADGADAPADDQFVCQQAQKSLRATGHAELREVHCRISAGIIVLRGTVGSYYLKQLAQAVVVQVDGVLAVANAIDVVPGAATRPANGGVEFPRPLQP